MSPALYLAALVPTVLAAPAPSLFGSLIVAANNAESEISNIIQSKVTSTLSALAAAVSSLGATLQTNGASHGSVWNYQSISSTSKSASSTRYSHTITWPSSTSYVNWTTYKANGVNFGAWLEQ